MHNSSTLCNDIATSTSSLTHSPPGSRSARISAWQEAIPKLAERSQFLLHGILACSALHLAYMNPSARQSYRITAARYQDLAMPLFREAVANLDDDNCHAILAFIQLLAVYSFASEQENERLLVVDPNGPDVVCGWLSFLRSGCDYVSKVRLSVEHGPLAALLCEWMKPVDMYKGPQIPLVERLLNIIPSMDHQDAWSQQECQIYRDAVCKLGYAFICAERLGKEFTDWDALRVWPLLLLPDYFELLRDLHAGALIVLAHYCSLLHRLNRKWYLAGRAKRLLEHIVQRLDSEWHSHINLPLE